MKYYNIEMVVYNEEEYKRIIEIIDKDYEWASALHNRDIDIETGEKIKDHIHIQIYGKSQKSIPSWAKLLNKKQEEIQKIDYKVKAIQYLIHKNNPEKYQYKKEIINSNFNIDSYFVEKGDEVKELKIIIEYIKNKPMIKYKEILEYAIEMNIWSTYRRNYTIIKDYIIEKNNLTRSNLFDTMKVEVDNRSLHNI